MIPTDNSVFLQGTPQTRTVKTVRGQGSILAAGLLTKQPATMAHRVVLVAMKDKIAVWDQMFPQYSLDNPDINQYHFSQGDYFETTELHLAYQRFGERCIKAATYCESVYRATASV